MKFKKYLLLLLSLSVLPLAGCNDDSSSAFDPANCPVLEDPRDLLETPITDGYTLSDELITRARKSTFSVDGIGFVGLKSNTDGDTANFYEGPDKISAPSMRTRFLGINTPESTKNVEPWGQPSKIFTAQKLLSAKEIILINDIDVFGLTESNGRYLAFIWYNTEANARFRLLNLEICEQAYSTNQLFKDSTLCPYRPLFEKCEEKNKPCKFRVYGEKNDPGYDYSDDVHEIDIRTVREQYDKYGSTDEGGTGKQLRVTGLIVGLMGDSFVLRDVGNEYDDGTFASIYCFTFGTSAASILERGYIVKLYCRATKYNGNMQLTDLKIDTYGKYKIEVFTPEDPEYASFPKADVNPIDMNCDNFTSYEDFKPYLGQHIKTVVTIREVTAQQDDVEGEHGVGDKYYYKKDDKDNMTVYAYSSATQKPLILNLRVTGGSVPYPSHTLFQVGKKYQIIGYLNAYFDKYQIMLYNNTYEYHFITPLEG